MATISVRIPNGNYCSDKEHHCFYAEHCRGNSYCHLFRHYIDRINDAIVEGEKTVVSRKCEPCLNALNGDIGLFSITVDTEDET